MGSIGDESEDGQSSVTHNDQDSDVPFENDTDEAIDTTVIEEENWIEYLKKKQKNEMETGAENGNITEWEMIEENCRMEPWTQLSKYRTNKATGRPRKRWEDDIDEFFKLDEDETENFIERSSQINKTWINTAKDRGWWTLLEDKYTMTAVERHENKARMRRNTQSRPARYVNGVRMSDEEVANTTQHKFKRRSKYKVKKMKLFEKQQQLRNQKLRDGSWVPTGSQLETDTIIEREKSTVGWQLRCEKRKRTWCRPAECDICVERQNGDLCWKGNRRQFSWSTFPSFRMEVAANKQNMFCCMCEPLDTS